MIHVHSAVFGPAAVLAAFLSGAGASAQQFQVGQNFTTANFNSSGYFPPDTMGAVGPTQVVLCINGQYSVFSKTGVLLRTRTLDQFWAEAGASPTAYSYDPRIAYDPQSQRWFAASGDEPESTASRFLLAVSAGSDVLGGWTGFRIDADPTNQRWADFPTLGVNSVGVFICANMFPVSTATIGLAAVVVPKSGLLLPTPSIAGMTILTADPAQTGYTLQPVQDADNLGTDLPIMSAYNSPSGFFKRSTITGPITAPVLATSGGFISVTAYPEPPAAPQPPIPFQKPPLDTGGSFLSPAAIRHSGFIWCVHSVSLSGRSALRWLKITATTNAVIQTGVLSSGTLSLYYPSIAVNDAGDVVVGCSGSSPTQPVSAYVIVGATVGGTITFGAPTLIKAGTDDYVHLDLSNLNRWGDYSATVQDPADQHRFWTFQEFVQSDDVWGVQATEIIIGAGCYANCDGSTAIPVLNVNDFICFQGRFAAGDSYANCDGSTNVPVLNVNDFICFQGRFASGCP